MKKFVQLFTVVIFILPFTFASFISGKNQAPLFLYLAMSVVVFLAYGSDKLRAIRKKRRLPEKWLHAGELFFGWPGALLAIYFFKHKTIKVSFRIILWSIIFIHLLIWIILCSGIY